MRGLVASYLREREEMFRRLLYVVILVAALSAAWFKGGFYLHEVHLGQARTPTGALDLGYLLAMVVLALIATRVLLRRGQNHADRSHSNDIARGVSVQRIRFIVRRAFSTNPISAGLVILLLILIPICLAALSVGGLRKLSLGNWILVVIAELPIAVVTIIGLSDGAPPGG